MKTLSAVWTKINLSLRMDIFIRSVPVFPYDSLATTQSAIIAFHNAEIAYAAGNLTAAKQLFSVAIDNFTKAKDELEAALVVSGTLSSLAAPIADGAFQSAVALFNMTLAFSKLHSLSEPCPQSVVTEINIFSLGQCIILNLRNSPEQFTSEQKNELSTALLRLFKEQLLRVNGLCDWAQGDSLENETVRTLYCEIENVINLLDARISSYAKRERSPVASSDDEATPAPVKRPRTASSTPAATSTLLQQGLFKTSAFRPTSDRTKSAVSLAKLREKACEHATLNESTMAAKR